MITRLMRKLSLPPFSSGGQARAVFLCHNFKASIPFLVKPIVWMILSTLGHPAYPKAEQPIQAPSNPIPKYKPTHDASSFLTSYLIALARDLNFVTQVVVIDGFLRNTFNAIFDGYFQSIIDKFFQSVR